MAYSLRTLIMFLLPQQLVARYMESKIPVPTDNIFKFYALFSLLLFIFSCGALIYSTQMTNQIIFSTVVELETLKEQPNPSNTVLAKIAGLERQKEIALKNRTFYEWVLGGLSGLSVWLGFYGFRRWHKDIQPVIDEMQRVQLEIARLQLEKLRVDMQASAKAPDAGA